MPLCALLLGALAACNESDPEALYIDALYQLRCIDCEPSVGDGIARDIHHLDGDLGFDLSCEVEPAAKGSRVSFSAEYVDPANEANNYSLEIDEAGLGDTAHGAACSVKVLDSGTSYEGRCADDEPTAERPCVVSLKREGDIVRGTVSCDKIPVQDMTTPYRYLRRPNSNKPVELELRGCSF